MGKFDDLTIPQISRLRDRLTSLRDLGLKSHYHGSPSGRVTLHMKGRYPGNGETMLLFGRFGPRCEILSVKEGSGTNVSVDGKKLAHACMKLLHELDDAS